MTATRNAKNLQYISRFPLIVELILTFASSPNTVRDMKKSVSKFQKNCLKMSYVIKHSYSVVTPILSLNSKQLHQKLYPNGLHFLFFASNLVIF